MTKVNPNNKSETKSDIFPWDIFKSETFVIKTYLIIWMTFKIEISKNQSFMTKVNPNSGTEIKSDLLK